MGAGVYAVGKIQVQIYMEEDEETAGIFGHACPELPVGGSFAGCHHCLEGEFNKL